VINQLKVDAADVLLYREQTRMLEYSAGRGWRGDSFRRFHIRLEEGNAARVAAGAIAKKLIRIVVIT
jgi:hypothetical protein